MNFHRRNFIRAGATGVVASMADVRLAFGDSQTGDFHGDLFKGGTGSVHLEGNTHIGPIEINAQDFIKGTDRTFIATAKVASYNLYRGIFSHENNSLIFAHLRDNQHTTTLTLSNTSDPSIGRLIVFNDDGPPEDFRIHIDTFIKTRNQRKSILDGRGKLLDQVGRRNPPPITPEELSITFREDPAYLAFMRGRPVDTTFPVLSEVNWSCAWICFVPACGIACIFWEPFG
jgi:hypothetical protein